MTPIGLSPVKVEKIVMACCSLHNFLCSHCTSSAIYTPQGGVDTENVKTHEVVPGDWRQGQQHELQPLQHQGSNRHSDSAIATRDYLRDYFNSEMGAVSWQNTMI